MQVPLEHILLLGACLFSIGLAIIVTRKNIIMVLMGIEMVFCAANINFAAFSYYDPELLQGQIFAVFVIVIAAAEAALALAIIYKIYLHFKTLNLEEINKLKG
jgi:NADH:ubiquinone oxidoreductase subunit K